MILLFASQLQAMSKVEFLREFAALSGSSSSIAQVDQFRCTVCISTRFVPEVQIAIIAARLVSCHTGKSILNEMLIGKKDGVFLSKKCRDTSLCGGDESLLQEVLDIIWEQHIDPMPINEMYNNAINCSITERLLFDIQTKSKGS